ncbi:hypothetical protein PR048_004203, partial [Dryococelus australis]
MFQKERPCVHKLYPEMCVLLWQLIASFVQFDIIQKCDITAVDVNKGNRLIDAGIFIGHKTRKTKNFFASVRRYYETGTRELYRLLPLDEVLKNIVILDPTHRSSALVVRFPTIIPCDKQDELQEDFISYSLRKPVVNLSGVDIETYWHTISKIEEKGKLRFPLLAKLAKASLHHNSAA